MSLLHANTRSHATRASAGTNVSAKRALGLPEPAALPEPPHCGGRTAARVRACGATARASGRSTHLLKPANSHGRAIMNSWLVPAHTGVSAVKLRTKNNTHRAAVSGPTLHPTLRTAHCTLRAARAGALLRHGASRPQREQQERHPEPRPLLTGSWRLLGWGRSVRGANRNRGFHRFSISSDASQNVAQSGLGSGAGDDGGGGTGGGGQRPAHGPVNARPCLRGAARAPRGPAPGAGRAPPGRVRAPRASAAAGRHAGGQQGEVPARLVVRHQE